MATEDQILLKLVIKGSDPSEIEQLARSTQGELNAKIKAYLDQLTQFHQQANAAQTADAVVAAQQQIDAVEKQIDTVSKVQRANEIAANRSENAWKSTLRVMESIAVTWEFTQSLIEGGIAKFGELGESIARVTEVHESLKGSIDSMREASAGEISDMDLILTKNRAMEKDLELSDAQFAAVTAGAHNYAKALGVDTKEALDKFIDGLAQGNLKALKHVGIMVDADTAYKEYAKSIGVAADQLSDHGKKIAIVQEALRLNDKKLAESSDAVINFGHTWKQTAAMLTNLWTEILESLGKMIMMAIEGFTIDLPDAIRLAIAKIKDLMPGSHGEAVAAVVAQHDKNLAAFYKDNAGEKEGEEARTRLADGTSGDYTKGSRADSINQKKVEEDAKKAQEELDKIQKVIDSFDKMLLKGSGLEKAGADAADILQRRQQTPDEKALGFGYDATASQFAQSGLNNSTARTKALQQAQNAMQERIARSMEAPNETNDLSRGTDSKGAMDRMEKTLKAAQERVDDLRKRAGDGILSTALFGSGGPGGIKEQLHTFAQDAADALGMVSAAGTKMGEALGSALAAFVSGDKSKRASLRQTTHDILEALATQAYSRAIFETAEGLASLALGPIGGASAGLHFAAAGMFTAVGTGAALTARAIGTSGTGAAATGASTGTASTGTSSGIATTTSGSGGFGSNGVRSTPVDNNQPINLYVSTMFGSEAETGRNVNKVLAAYYAQTGQGVPAAQVAA